ncbi:MAG: type II toxin-antitoxin system RelE/ParE family toxin [Planctomycetia bacterium]|nr:type II toxin-antitoxin system RelE/ParE family toxin [Planctomycetia bacterium]
MTLRIVLRPPAENDLLQAKEWYAAKSVELGDDFATKFEEALARVQAMPELYAATYRNVRKAKLRRFPYVVYYRILTDRIEVLAVLHGGRNPRIWRDRA